MEITAWTICETIAKLFIYIGTISSLTIPFIIWISNSHQHLTKPFIKYYSSTIIAALLSTAFMFFIQIGKFSESGVIGMFDPNIISILWQSNTSLSLLLRIIGFGLSLSIYFIIKDKKLKTTKLSTPIIIGITFYLLSLLILSRSYSVIGHTVDLSTDSQLLLSIHIIAVSWWLGSLLPLWYICRQLNNHELYNIMHIFGKLAMYIVLILIITGSCLVFQLIHSKNDLLNSNYGQAFIIKILLVIIILIIAASHKWKKVPYLRTNTTKKTTLSTSIMVETLFALFILTTTAILTTLTGPPH